MAILTEKILKLLFGPLCKKKKQNKTKATYAEVCPNKLE